MGYIILIFIARSVAKILALRRTKRTVAPKVRTQRSYTKTSFRQKFQLTFRFIKFRVKLSGISNVMEKQSSSSAIVESLRITTDKLPNVRCVAKSHDASIATSSPPPTPFKGDLIDRWSDTFDVVPFPSQRSLMKAFYIAAPLDSSQLRDWAQDFNPSSCFDEILKIVAECIVISKDSINSAFSPLCSKQTV